MKKQYKSKNSILFKHLLSKENSLNHLNANVTTPYNIRYCLNSIAIAQGGIAELSKKTGLGRESLYKSLAPSHNPRFDTILKIIRGLGFDIKFIPLEEPMVDRHIRENSFAHRHPNFALYWHPLKNKNITPNDITPGSKKKIWWQCLKNREHEWQKSPLSIINSNENECPKCE